MPLGTGGLLRYHEEEEMFVIKPEQVFLLGIGVLVLEFLLKFFLA